MCSVFSAGSNAHGQLAHGSDEDSHCFKQCIFHGIGDGELSGGKILSIATGANHTLLLLRSPQGVTQLWGCGNGKRGQLGAKYHREFGASTAFQRIFLDHDDTRCTEYADVEITLIAASWETSFVVLSRSENDVILSTGSDDFGDLGVGGLSDGQKETDVWCAVGFKHVLPKNVSRIRISDLKAGPHNVLAKLLYQDADKQEVELILGWGAARQSQLGQGPASTMPHAIHTSPKVLAFPSHISAFAVGSQHTVFLTSEGTVLALGSNKKGQLSGIDAVKNICAVNATWNGSYLLKKHESADKWTVLASGSNSHGQLAIRSATAPQLHEIGLPADASGTASLSIICGSEHVLIASQSDQQNGDGVVNIFAWGWNEHGNLGLGHTLDVHALTRIWPSSDHPRQGNTVGVWAGCATTWIAVDAG